MNKAKFGILSVVALTTLSTVSIQSPVQASQYYDNPTIKSTNGSQYRISTCVNSYRFPTQEDMCSQEAKNLIAQEFCSFKGFSGWEYYRTEDIGWDNRTWAFWWTERYERGAYRESFRTKGDTSGLFTLIVCTN